MKKLIPLLSLLVFSTSGFASDRPNIIFIAIDDLNDWLGCYGGHPQAITPNIDRLAEQGVLFSNAHCAAPVCKSSRTAAFSGRHPIQTGVYGNRDPDILKKHPETVFLPEVLAEAGYDCAGAGKLLHGSAEKIFKDFFYPEQRWSPFTKEAVKYTEEELPSKGTDSPRHLIIDGPGGTEYVLPLNRMPSDRRPSTLDGESFDWGAVDVPDSSMGDGQITDWAIDQLNRKRTKPLFLGVGYYRPHIPLWAPKQDFDVYPPVEDIELPPYLETDLDDIGEAGNRRAIEAVTAGSHATVVEHDQWKEAVRAYLASVTFVDRQIGKLLEALENSSHADNTLIVLWSDHGWQLGEKDHWGKWTGWRQSTRVPLIVAQSRSKADAPRGVVCEEPVSLLDLYPTLASVANLPSGEHLAGTSLMPLLENPQLETDRFVLTTFDRGNHALSGNRWRYLRYQEGDEELYDIESDPNEWKNLADESEYAEKLRTMREQMDEQLSRISK